MEAVPYLLLLLFLTAILTSRQPKKDLMTNPSPLRWTPHDERLWHELSARRDAVTSARRQVLEAALRGTEWGSLLFAQLPKHPMTREALLDDFAKHADAIRDALEPFDSGARQAPQSLPHHPV